VTYTSLATVGSAKAFHRLLPLLGEALSVTWLEVEGTEFIDANAATVHGATRVKSADSPILGPELGVCGLLPGLRMPPVDLTSLQQCTQPFQTNTVNDSLAHQVLPEFAQRPLGHTDQCLRGRQSDLRNLLDHICKKPPGTAGTMKDRIPLNGRQSSAIEAMNDFAYPAWAVSNKPGDLPIADSPAREQNNPRMRAVDVIAPLSFHLMQSASLVRCHSPYPYSEHFGASVVKTSCTGDTQVPFTIFLAC